MTIFVLYNKYMDIDKKLSDAIDNMSKKYGDGAIIQSSEKINIQRMSTGSLALDVITGGGYPIGKFIEFISPESCGKTTIAIHGMISAQKNFPNKRVAIIDTEHAFDSSYASGLGLNMEEVLFVQPSCGEEGMDIASELIDSGSVSMVVIDSIAALTPKKEVDGEVGAHVIGLHAKLMSQSCRILASKANKTGTIVYWTNQIRDKIGVMFGSPETTTGGNAMKYYASIRIDLRKKMNKDVDDNGNMTVVNITAKTIKNKTFPPFRKESFDIEFGKGIDKASEVLSLGANAEIITKGGSWYYYEDTKLGQGAHNACKTLNENPDLMDIIECKIREHHGIG